MLGINGEFWRVVCGFFVVILDLGFVGERLFLGEVFMTPYLMSFGELK